jgi:REP element-mobilizing transposase RayT
VSRKKLPSAKGADQIVLMPQSFASIIIQIVFSTKERSPWLDESIGPRMHAYLAEVCREATGVAFAVGGAADHVHVATALPRTLAVADLVEKLKVTSSIWIKEVSPAHGGFHWQRGYGAFSVGASGKEALIAYVQNQERHHKGRGFQDEYRELLTLYGEKWDERYVWD